MSSSGAVLSANEVWGALRGLETFSQLVVRDETGEVSADSIIITPSKFINTCIMKHDVNILFFQTPKIAVISQK